MTKKLLLLLLITLCLPAIVNAQTEKKEVAGKPLQTVGLDSRKFIDPKRQNWSGTGPKTVRVLLWYPAYDRTGNPHLVGNADKVPVIKSGAFVTGPEKYPLILLSHGSGGMAMDLAAWAFYLAARGYIVAAIEHRGDSTENAETGFLSLSDQQMWQRPQDVSAVLTSLLADSLFGPRIDTAKIAVAGFSLGGYTAIAVAGARLNLESLQASSDTKNLSPQVRNSVERYIELLGKNSILQASLAHSGDSYKDRRIKGVFALAPAIGQGFTKEGLSDIDVPVYIVAGETDVVAPKELNAELYASGIKDATLTILPGEAGHITRPGPVAEQNWQKVYDLSYHFFEGLWLSKR
ncbi:alpha/beta hydrolase family protein [Parafilimonas sp.]|uniref:alpha/beta hydrolase family protein n=1 Tax=Parafilimonas sp. TaxID=1969739 RepID=UPI003F7F6E19